MMTALLILCPPFVIGLWFIMTEMKGSLSSFLVFWSEGGINGFIKIWPRPTLLAWEIIGVFGVFEAFLLLWVPGREWEGPVSPAGNRPVYRMNGVPCYFLSIGAYLAIWRLGWFDPGLVYDHLGEIFQALIIGAFGFCTLLYIKGWVSPSSDDWGSSGSIIQDFFWGMELYPRIGKNFDIKTFTNCRFGMMTWALLPITYAIKQYQVYGSVSDSMVVSVGLMLVYVTKFFWWEDGYWSTMDIMHDRAGYYICWGCLVWVPSIYTSPAMYLVQHPIHLGIWKASFIFFLGILSIWINYDSDRQRQYFRKMEGKCLIWGRPPVKIEAQYVTEKGEKKTSLLLVSGWWGLSRHFHYVPEILASFFWTLPGLFEHGLQYFYVFYLTILLMDRAIRDDERCKKKYGKYWDMYCEKVPYKVIPGIY